MADPERRKGDEEFRLALVRLESKVDQLATGMGSKLDRLGELLDDKFERLSQSMEFGDKQVAQMVQLMEPRMEALRVQVQQLQSADATQVTANQTRIAELESRVQSMELSRAKLIGFGFGLAALSGGVGGLVAQVLP